jgi:hypothetical protein
MMDPFFLVEVDMGADALVTVGPFPTRDAAREAALEFQAKALKRLTEAAGSRMDVGVEEYNEPREASCPTVDEGVRVLRRILK